MRLTRWNRWVLLLIGTLRCFSEGYAQYDSKLPTELDRLRLWYPVMPMEQPVPARSQSYVYTSLNELLQRVRAGEKVEALSLAGFIAKQGNLAVLGQLQTVRVLHVSDLTGPQLDSLFNLVQHWPALERLTISAYSGNLSTPLVRLPQYIQHFPSLHDVRLQGNRFQWNDSFDALARLKTLRSLSVESGYPAVDQPVTFRRLPQLRKLAVQGQNWRLDAETFAGLSQLHAFNLSNLTIDTLSFRRVLDGLPNLDTLTIQNCPTLTTLNVNGLQKLKALDLYSNNNLTLSAGSLTRLPALERLVIRQAKTVDMSDLCALTHLRTLWLAGQGKEITVPDCFDQLTQLTELRLENLLLPRFPASIGTLAQLQELYVTFCKIDSIPAAAFNQMSRLRALSLMGNKLRSIPAIGQLRALEMLILINNQLTVLPGDIGRLTQLTSLMLDQNKLTQLPASVGQLTSLKTLDLADNQLTTLPSELGRLRNLKYLTLGSNQLTTLPDNLSQLDSLVGLTIGANKLRTLPAGITQLKKLKNLLIGANELTVLPEAIGALTQLTNLIIESNPLTELPTSLSSLQNLQSLNIIGTKLRLLPDNIGALTNLQSLGLTNNELIALPGSIGRCTNLTSMSLYQNKLEGLPNSIGRLAKLRDLSISGKENVTQGATGGLQQLPDSIVFCPELVRVSIQNQPELDADDALGKLARLKRLSSLILMNCNLTHLPEIAWKDVRWQNLVLMQNALTDLPTGLLDAPELRSVSVQNNPLPAPLNHSFYTKDALRVAFVEAGKLPLESLPKPSRHVMNAFQQLSTQKAQQQDWPGALADLEKAIEYAPDTIRAYSYAQRAGMHFFRKEYSDALADYDKAIRYAPLLRLDKSIDSLLVNRLTASYWQQKAAVLGATSQYDAALTAITKAESILPLGNDQTPTSGLIFTERGRYLSLNNKAVEADSSYRKAIRAYEKLPYAEPGIRLTIVELSILTGQYDRAQKVIANLPAEQIRDGYDVLKEYLGRCVAVLKNEQTGALALENLTAYLAKHPAKIYGWSFDLFDDWLTKSKLNADKLTALRQLTDATKERLVKPQ